MMVTVLRKMAVVIAVIKSHVTRDDIEEATIPISVAKAKPVLQTLPGWKTDVRGIDNYDELPENCRGYIEFIEGQIGFPIDIVSNGPGRNEVIYR